MVPEQLYKVWMQNEAERRRQADAAKRAPNLATQARRVRCALRVMNGGARGETLRLTQGGAA